MSTPIDRLLAEANPVATPPPGRVTPGQERLLATIVAAPPAGGRRGVPRAVRVLAVASAMAAAVVAVVLVAGRDAGIKGELEATRPGTPAADVEHAELVHVVTRLYGTVYGPEKGERLDGWFQPSTGRVRIVITTGGHMTMQQVVSADDRVTTWQGALGNYYGPVEEHRSSKFAGELRASVRDRIASLIASAKYGFRHDAAVVGAPTTEAGEYHGRRVTIHRIAPTLERGGGPSGYYFKWFVDAETGATIAFERGPVGPDGKDQVETGEELVSTDLFTSGDASLEQLDWREPPAAEMERPPAPAATPTPTLLDGDDLPLPTPTPTPPAATPAPPG